MKFHFPWVLEHTDKVTDVQWLVVSTIGFLLVAWLVVKFVWPQMIQPHLTDRHRSIVQAAEQVETTLRETQQMRNDYKQRLERIEDEAERRIAEAMVEAANLRGQILDEAKQTAGGLARRGEEEVDRERAKARQQLRTQVVQGAINAAQYAATNSLNDSNKRRLSDEFVAELGGKA
jgi:F-type H+-transporting ATPase subunit b